MIRDREDMLFDICYDVLQANANFIKVSALRSKMFEEYNNKYKDKRYSISMADLNDYIDGLIECDYLYRMPDKDHTYHDECYCSGVWIGLDE